VKILITDDHAVVRSGFKEVLAAQLPTAVFGEAASAREALELVWREDWDVVVTDITMPGRSGLDLLKEIRIARPSLPVLVLTVHTEQEYAVRVLKAGAAGFLNKDSAVEELVVAVKRVLAGRKYISPSLAERLANAAGEPAGDLPHERLSDREFQVLRMLGAGMSVKEIAGDLSLSAKTISTYRARILKKMNLRTTADLVRYAMIHYLVQS
jgi:two-component system invasion response regulator UvrY